MTRTFAIAIAAGAAGAVLAAGAAQATVVERSGSTLSVLAAPLEVNDLVLRAVASGELAIADRAQGVTTRAEGCRPAGGGAVRCDTSGIAQVVVAAGDGNDGLTADGVFPAYDVTADMGAERDAVALGFKPADIDNSTVGQILVRGGPGDDAVRVAFAAADVSRGAVGAITVDAGEGDDDVRAFKPADVENSTLGAFVAILGAGNDRAHLGLLGTTYGGSGDDRLWGGAGAQALYGDEGRDRLAGGAGDGDLCDGGADADRYGPGCEATVYGLGDTGTHEVGHYSGT